MKPVAVTRDGEEAAGARERLAAPAVALPAVHQPGVDAERHVVEEDSLGHAADVGSPLDAILEGRERPDRVVPVEAHVAGEMVPRAERDADERGTGLECDPGDGAERAVASRHAENLGPRGLGPRARALAPGEDVRLDAEPLRRGDELIGARRIVPRPGVDDQESLGLHGPQVEPNGPWRPSGAVSIMAI